MRGLQHESAILYETGDDDRSDECEALANDTRKRIPMKPCNAKGEEGCKVFGTSISERDRTCYNDATGTCYE